MSPSVVEKHVFLQPIKKHLGLLNVASSAVMQSYFVCSVQNHLGPPHCLVWPGGHEEQMQMLMWKESGKALFQESSIWFPRFTSTYSPLSFWPGRLWEPYEWLPKLWHPEGSANREAWCWVWGKKKNISSVSMLLAPSLKVALFYSHWPLQSAFST